MIGLKSVRSSSSGSVKAHDGLEPSATSKSAHRIRRHIHIQVLDTLLINAISEVIKRLKSHNNL